MGTWKEQADLIAAQAGHWRTIEIAFGKSTRRC